MKMNFSKNPSKRVNESNRKEETKNRLERFNICWNLMNWKLINPSPGIHSSKELFRGRYRNLNDAPIVEISRGRIWKSDYFLSSPRPRGFPCGGTAIVPRGGQVNRLTKGYVISRWLHARRYTRDFLVTRLLSLDLSLDRVSDRYVAWNPIGSHFSKYQESRRENEGRINEAKMGENLIGKSHWSQRRKVE